MEITKEELIHLGFELVDTEDMGLFLKTYHPPGGAEARLYTFAVIGQNNEWNVSVAEESSSLGISLRDVNTMEQLKALYELLSDESL